ncbi:MAG: DNA primase [Sulfobacillus acidophilus]|uniref:DNA primase n=1 Tax=Sulfobacillus acidophilus TaxID=53633 RepID=A0A2T2WKU2_9FIRM|nr:MAG: DNA primase [Sulfobacillus acidophilus]
MQIRHPNRILYPQPAISRAEVVRYYAAIAPYLLRQANGRGLTLRRWPHGVEGPAFYQKHLSSGAPITVQTFSDVIAWVQRGALEWHAPLGCLTAPELHDWAILDLDPNPPADWNRVVDVARVVRHLLGLMHIPFLLKTSGQRGLHFYIAIRPYPASDVVRIMGRLAQIVVQIVPDLATTSWLKRDRGSRVYLDYLQNTRTRTTVMAYSLRATPTATVSMPIDWDEVDAPPSYWTMPVVLNRLREGGDAFRWQGPHVDLDAVNRRYGPKSRRCDSDG